MADNLSTLRDGYDKSSDWIEIQNAGDQAIDLAGWHLTDSPGDLTKWTFPSETLAPGEYLVVFASGRGTANPEDSANVDPAGSFHTNFGLDSSGDYLALVADDGVTIASEFGTAGTPFPAQAADVSYGLSQDVDVQTWVDVDAATRVLIPTSSLPPGWAGDDPLFDDDPQTTDWFAANLAAGYDVTGQYAAALAATGDLESAMQGVAPTALFRTRFEVADPSAIAQLSLEMAYDDGFAAYLNGELVATRNAPATLSAGSTATASHDALGGGYPLDPANRAVLYTFENNTGQNFTDKLTADGAQQPNVEFNAPGAVVVDGDPANAAFGDRSLQLADATSPEFNRFEISDTTNLGSQFTLAMQVDFENLDFQRLFSNYQGTGSVGADRIIVDVDPSGANLATGFRIFIGGRGTVEATTLPAALLQPGYHHVAVTYDNGAVRGYVDGQLVASGTLGSGPVNTPLNLYVGEDPHDGGGSANEQLVAHLDDVLVLAGEALGADEITTVATVGAESFFTTGGTAPSFESIDLSGFVDDLQAGENILAIHGLNASAADDDFFILPKLTATTPPEGGAAGYHAIPTPGGPNGATLTDLVADTNFSVDRGFYDGPFTVDITTATPGATIAYTTDGSVPTPTHGTQVAPPHAAAPSIASVSITGTTTLRAMAYKDNWVDTNVDTQTYLFLNDVISQPALPPGVPDNWGGFPADYEMDPNVVNVPPYSHAILDSLRAVPTVSLVLPGEDFFESGGIYAHPTNKGRLWERETSVEYFDPNSTDEFQIDAGLRVHGGSSRSHSITPAHSLRLHFRGEYGATKLEFPLYEGLDSTTFDTIVLDANSSDNWTSVNTATGRVAQFIRNQWAKDTQRDMGNLAVPGKFVHVYINGLYWGLYDMLERIDDGFAANHHGGEKEDYDVIVDESARDGDMTAFNQLLSAARAGDYDATADLLDIDSFIDYNIVQMYTGNWDWPDHNWEAVRRRAPGEKFEFVIWDAEVGLGLDVNVPGPIRPNVLDVDLTGSRADVSSGALAGGPGELYNLLKQQPEFQLRFADRLTKHFSGGGALTPENATARYLARADEIELALVAEAARWGDVRREPPDVPDGVWADERDWIVGTFFTQRGAIVLDQFRTQGLYVDAAPPEPRINGAPNYGGPIRVGDELSFGPAAGTIYYTLDGPDPRIPDTQSNVSLVAADAEKRALVPQDGTLGTTWTGGDEILFAALGGDDAWLVGTEGVGYEVGQGAYDADIGIDVEAAMYNNGANPGANTSVYIRTPLVVDQATIDALSQLTLRMRYDDAFIAYLNGVEIARQNYVGTPTWNAAADAGNEATAFVEFDVLAHLDLLNVGDNILAVQGMNVGTSSSDLLFVPELVGQVAAGVAPSAAAYAGNPIPLTETTDVKTRILYPGGAWSPAIEVAYEAPPRLIISEINYHPADATPTELLIVPGADDNDFEFIELQNVGGEPFDLTGVKFVEGIEFDFTGSAVTSIPPGGYVLVVKDEMAFTARYGPGLPVAGAFAGGTQLSNGGEAIQLVDGAGTVLHSFSYGDDPPWPTSPDGDGHTLILIDSISAPDYNVPTNWRASIVAGGSPGAADPTPGDFDLDGLVAGSDFLAWQRNYPAGPGATVAQGDANGDGLVAADDLGVWETHYGAATASPALASSRTSLFSEATAATAPSPLVGDQTVASGVAPMRWQPMSRAVYDQAEPRVFEQLARRRDVLPARFVAPGPHLPAAAHDAVLEEWPESRRAKGRPERGVVVAALASSEGEGAEGAVEPEAASTTPFEQLGSW